MRFLLDTNILLWAAADALPQKAAEYINNLENELLFSSASIWEVVIKNGLGRSDFCVNPTLLYSGLIRSGYTEVTVESKHTLLVASLPEIHKDPFDRILLAQATYLGIPLITSDRVVASYSKTAILV